MSENNKSDVSLEEKRFAYQRIVIEFSEMLTEAMSRYITLYKIGCIDENERDEFIKHCEQTITKLMRVFGDK